MSRFTPRSIFLFKFAHFAHRRKIPRFLPLDLPVGTCTHNVQVKGRSNIDAGLSFTCPYSADLSGSSLMLSSLMVIDVGGAEELQQRALCGRRLLACSTHFPCCWARSTRRAALRGRTVRSVRSRGRIASRKHVFNSSIITTPSLSTWRWQSAATAALSCSAAFNHDNEIRRGKP